MISPSIRVAALRRILRALSGLPFANSDRLQLLTILVRRATHDTLPRLQRIVLRERRALRRAQRTWVAKWQATTGIVRRSSMA